MATPEQVQRVLDLRRGARTTPRPNAKRYVRRAKHVKKEN